VNSAKRLPLVPPAPLRDAYTPNHRP
jgi:hypothetical protein